MAEDRRDVTITAKVSRRVYFQFRDLCQANGVAVYQGIEEALRATLVRAGVEVVVGESEDRAGGGGHTAG